MKNYLKLLNEPFPERGTLKENLISLLGVSTFITLFLYFFRPFGLNVYPYSPFWICVVFGVITFLSGLFMEFMTGFILKINKDIPSWTLGKWILEVFVNILIIGISNFIFVSYLMNWMRFTIPEFLMMVFFTFIVGLFPIVYSGMRIQMKAIKFNQQQAANLQATLHEPKKNERIVNLNSQNNSQSLKVSLDHLLYLEASQNYVSIHHLEEGTIQKTMFRNTLSEMENQLQATSMFRCHRSFIVNTDLIENVEGNAQGLRITLSNLGDIKIPVSRKYIQSLKSLIG